MGMVRWLICRFVIFRNRDGQNQSLANVALCTGFWSDGRRLKDSAKMGAEGLRASATTVTLL